MIKRYFNIPQIKQIYKQQTQPFFGWFKSQKQDEQPTIKTNPVEENIANNHLQEQDQQLNLENEAQEKMVFNENNDTNQDNDTSVVQNYNENLPQMQFQSVDKEDPGTRRKSFYPPFQKLTNGHLLSYTPFSELSHLNTPFFWTPLIQKIQPRIEFYQQLYKISKYKNWTEENTKELIDCFLFESLKDTSYDYYYDYKCFASNKQNFHGVADFLIYNKEGDQIPFVPVLIAEKGSSRITGMTSYDFDIAPAVGAAMWAFSNMRARNRETKYARVLQTNGHIWKMYEININGELKKTQEYKPKSTKGIVAKIYHDREMQEVILGLIRFASSIHTENELRLQQAYFHIDQAKYMTVYDDEMLAEQKKRMNYTKFLPKRIREFLFGIKY